MQNKQVDSLIDIDKNKTLKAIDRICKNEEANKLVPGFRKIDRELEIVELVCTKTDGNKFNFNRFLLPFKFIEKFHNN